MHLARGKLVIRNATSEDAEVLCKWWNDSRVMEHAGFPLGLGTTTQKIISELATDDRDHSRLLIEIDSMPVGEMSYRRKDGNAAEIGIKICDFNEQNKGYGTIFLSMLIAYLFKEMDYEKIVLDTNMKNTRAQHVYESIGFKKVAINTNSWKNQTGELQSSIDYELNRDNFFAKKAV